MKFTGKTFAWISSDWKSYAELLEMTGDGDRAVDYLSYSAHDMGGSGWIKVGEAKVTVELLPQDEMHASQLDALNKKLAAIRADNQQRENFILDQISKLQALTFTESA
jgi:hypothetical protein